MGCSQDTVRYNRGIGVYPGNPDEDFSPEMQVDRTYRNIALNRAVYSSSSYDYCLTGQLVTDGVISDSLPKYLTMETSEGRDVKRQREWLVDQHKYTRLNLIGDNAYIQLALKNGWSETFDRIYGEMYVSYQDSNADGSHEIKVTASNDGINWDVLQVIRGRRFVGEESRPLLHSDPDKADALGNQLLPTRKFRIDAQLPQAREYSMFRVDMNMKGAEQWIAANLDIYRDGELVSLIPSKNFNSTWMSAGKENEWMYVDLGNKAKFDKIVLSWLQKPLSAVVQVSDDAQSWKDIAKAASGDGLTETIMVKGKGRYVRLAMEAEAGVPVMLSEMQVWGKGGVSAKAKPAPAASDKEICLSGGNWRLIRSSFTAAEGGEIASEGFDDSGWLVATVPGTVLSSYINLGAVPQPNYADNIFQISDSYFFSDFWYTRRS